MPLVLVVVGILQLVFGIGETVFAGRSASLGLAGTIPEGRWLVMSAYVRVVADCAWTLGFAAIVYAANEYLDRGESA